jgi:hypothetical protein
MVKGFRQGNAAPFPGVATVTVSSSRGFAMKASDLDKQPSHSEMPTAREWLRVVGAAVAIVVICVLWTFWV